MSRLNVVTDEQAKGRVRELYDGLKKAVGKVPNIYQGLGNSPAALARSCRLARRCAREA
jgi:hypothetical protein